MKLATLFLSIAALTCAAQQPEEPNSEKASPPAPVCEVAAPALRASDTTEIALMMTLDAQGKVESFKTEFPRGLKLEKNKDAKKAIRSMVFRPATKDGQPVRVLIRIVFDCSNVAE